MNQQFGIDQNGQVMPINQLHSNQVQAQEVIERMQQQEYEQQQREAEQQYVQQQPQQHHDIRNVHLNIMQTGWLRQKAESMSHKITNHTHYPGGFLNHKKDTMYGKITHSHHPQGIFQHHAEQIAGKITHSHHEGGFLNSKKHMLIGKVHNSMSGSFLKDKGDQMKINNNIFKERIKRFF